MMRRDTRRELLKLRELVHFLLAGAGGSKKWNVSHGAYVCYFCEEEMHDLEFIEHGNAVGPTFTERLSIHHIDGDHDNNVMSNKALCHTKCHKAHHRREANLARGGVKP